MADFMVIQVICVALVLVFPSIAMWFPNWLQERAKAERMREQSAMPMSSISPVNTDSSAGANDVARARALSQGPVPSTVF
jgi:hypothetical protein